MDFGIRVKYLRERLDLTQEQLATMVGYSGKASINKIELGLSDVSRPKIAALAKALNTTPSYLMGWTDNPEPRTDYNLPDNVSKIAKSKVLPILGEIACGDPVFAETNYQGYLSVDNKLKADFCLKIKGDSMTGDGIEDGDLAFIKQDTTADHGQIAAVLLDNEATLKRVYVTDEGYLLQPSNPYYRPILIKGDIVILGRLVGIFKKFH